MKKRIPLIFVLALFAGFAGCLWAQFRYPKLKEMALPPRHAWQPEGCKVAAQYPDLVPNDNIGFYLQHADIRNSDEVSNAIAPVMELDWIAEPDMYVYEGLVFDREGNIYFSPMFSPERVILVSLEPGKGARRWAVPGFSFGNGTPMVLDDPLRKGGQIVYLGSYHRALAVRTDGTVVWDARTGLDTVKPDDDPTQTHSYGINYHPQTDSLIGVTGDGHVYALDRATGKSLLDEPYMLPGERSPVKDPPILKIMPRLLPLYKRFSKGLPEKNNIPLTMARILLGNGVKVANFFSVDPVTGTIIVAGTAPDEIDGAKDGVSEMGALYGLELKPDGKGKFAFSILYRVDFAGGSASTPSLSADGSRIYLGDNFGKLLAIESSSGRLLWDIDLGGDQIPGSVGVASDNNEIYAITAKHMHKVVDRGDRGEAVWRSDYSAYKLAPFQSEMNILLASPAPNGVGIVMGAGYFLGPTAPMPLKLAVGLLDRETGRLRYCTRAREESIAPTTIGPDGGIYQAHSPLRRALSLAIFPKSMISDSLIGGIARYKPVRHDLFFKDIISAMTDRLKKMDGVCGTCGEVSIQADISAVKVLLRQAEKVYYEGVKNGDIKQKSPMVVIALNNARRLLDGGIASDNYSKAAGYLKEIDRYIKQGNLY